MIDLARVIKVHWETNSVDLVMSSDGRTISGVRVMASSASTNTGIHDLPMPETNDPLKMKSTKKTRDIIAVVSYFNEVPVVLGFLHPRDTQMLFSDKERMVYRHASDVYQTIDKDGNVEMHHPGGAYVRFGTSAAHEDLTGKDYNKQWKIAKNTDKQVHIHIEQAGGVALIDIAPDGAIAITTATTVSVNATGDATVISGGNVSVSAAGTAKVQAGGKATVKGASIDLDAGAMKGVVQGDCVCSFTGQPHGQFSGTVKASV